jgi:hypothetical protein
VTESEDLEQRDRPRSGHGDDQPIGGTERHTAEQSGQRCQLSPLSTCAFASDRSGAPSPRRGSHAPANRHQTGAETAETPEIRSGDWQRDCSITRPPLADVEGETRDGAPDTGDRACPHLACHGLRAAGRAQPPRGRKHSVLWDDRRDRPATRCHGHRRGPGQVVERRSPSSVGRSASPLAPSSEASFGSTCRARSRGTLSKSPSMRRTCRPVTS